MFTAHIWSFPGLTQRCSAHGNILKLALSVCVCLCVLGCAQRCSAHGKRCAEHAAASGAGRRRHGRAGCQRLCEEVAEEESLLAGRVELESRRL